VSTKVLGLKHSSSSPVLDSLGDLGIILDQEISFFLHINQLQAEVEAELEAVVICFISCDLSPNPCPMMQVLISLRGSVRVRLSVVKVD